MKRALSDSLEAEHHLPVVDENGDLQGQLSREAVAEVFADTGQEEADQAS